MDAMLAHLSPDRIADAVLAFLPRLGVALAILLAFFVLFRLSRPPLSAVLRRAGMHDKLVELLVGSIYRYTLLAIGLLMALGQVGVNVTAAVAGLGVLGIAVGFAAQDSLSNVISGIIIFIDTPFLVGDWITAEERFGMVTDITLRSTRIRTARNTYVVIPNKEIINAVIENYSKHGELRVDVPVGIAYKEDVQEARRVLLQAARSVDGVRTDPAPDVVMTALGGSSIDLDVRVWIDAAALRQATFFAVLESCKLALDEAGIEIPFPHLQLFVDTVEDRVWERLSGLVASG